MREIGLFHSSDLERAYLNLSANTHPKEDAIEHKKRIVRELRNRNLFSPEIQRNYPLVYVASGLDIEYPLLLGGRKVILVDPIFANEDSVTRLTERIKGLTNSQVRQERKKLVFEFDFGEGKEEVNVTVEGVFYSEAGRKAELDFLSKVPKPTDWQPEEELESKQEELGYFQPPKQIGMILGFRTSPDAAIDSNQVAMAGLVRGGIILVDEALNILFRMMKQDESLLFESEEDRKPFELMKRKYESLGFEFIELQEEGQYINYTFLKKL